MATQWANNVELTSTVDINSCQQFDINSLQQWMSTDHQPKVKNELFCDVNSQSQIDVIDIYLTIQLDVNLMLP